MTNVHSIRLHGPWNARVLEGYEPAELVSEPERRLKIPSDWADWLGTSFRGRVEYQRRFGLPAGLEPQQRVWLVVSDVDYRANIFLNGSRIGECQLGSPAFRSEVRGLLQRSNLLNIEVELPREAERESRASLAGGLIGAVRLEIEES